MKDSMSNISFRVMFVALVSLALCGCASVHESYGPDGRKVYAINCSGLARGWDKCQIAAGNICGSAGYEVIDSVSEDSESATAVANTSGGLSHSSKSNERSMLISCKR